MPTPTIQDAIRALTEDFARQLLAAVREATVEQILLKRVDEVGSARKEARSVRAVTRPTPKPAQHQRRTTTDLESLLERAVALLEEHPDGLRAERLRASLGVPGPEARRIASLGIERKQIYKRGAKRGTTYFTATSRGKPRPKDASQPPKATRTPLPTPAGRSTKKRNRRVPLTTRAPRSPSKATSKEAKRARLRREESAQALAVSESKPSSPKVETAAAPKLRAAKDGAARRGAHVVVSESGKAAGFKSES